ncbi:MAG: sigma-70 family RNA polymerase sigma factor [Clostridium sp.]|uniref:RNA polymerase sigma factor n=1 Tax=Clostridium sp. TaxID=1506 RepID=UPI00302BA83F
MKASQDENFQNNMLKQLYDAYEYKMYGIAYSILNNVGQAEDAVQDAFIKLIPHLGDINSPVSIETKRLITYTIKNIAIDIYRRNRKESELFTKGVDEPMTGGNQQGIDSVKTVEDRQIVVQLLSSLPSKYREIIRYRCYYEFSYKEISLLLNISEKVAAKRCERAKKLLKEIMEKEMMGDELYG